MASDNKILEQWVEEYTSALYSRALYKVSNSELAEDLVQDTFMVASEKVSDFNWMSSPKTWLFSILNNKIVDHYRKKINKTTSLDNDYEYNHFDEDGKWLSSKSSILWNDKDSNLLDDEEFNLILARCMSALPEKWSFSMKLKYLTDKSGEEICQELGITSSNYWQIVRRAKLQLRDCINENWFKK